MCSFAHSKSPSYGCRVHKINKTNYKASEMSGVSLCLGLRGPLEDATSHVRRERGGLQQQKCTLSQFWRSESKIKCPRGHGPQRALGEGPPSLSQLLVAPGIVWLVKHHPIPCLCLHVAFPVSLFVPSCL